MSSKMRDLFVIKFLGFRNNGATEFMYGALLPNKLETCLMAYFDTITMPMDGIEKQVIKKMHEYYRILKFELIT